MALVVSYESKALRDLCRKEMLAAKLFSLPVARSIRARVDDLTAAESLNDLPFIYEVIEKMPPGCFRLALTNGYYMHFLPVDQELPLNDDGSVCWGQVRWVKLAEISQDD